MLFGELRYRRSLVMLVVYVMDVDYIWENFIFGVSSFDYIGGKMLYDFLGVS